MSPVHVRIPFWGAAASLAASHRHFSEGNALPCRAPGRPRSGAPRPSGCHPIRSPPGPSLSSPRAEHVGILWLVRSRGVDKILEAARSTVEVLVCPGSGHEGEFDSPHPRPRPAHAACFTNTIPRLAGPRRRHFSVVWQGQLQRRARGRSGWPAAAEVARRLWFSCGRSASGPGPAAGSARACMRGLCSCVARRGEVSRAINRWLCLNAACWYCIECAERLQPNNKLMTVHM